MLDTEFQAIVLSSIEQQAAYQQQQAAYRVADLAFQKTVIEKLDSIEKDVLLMLIVLESTSRLQRSSY